MGWLDGSGCVSNDLASCQNGINLLAVVLANMSNIFTVLYVKDAIR